MSRSSRYYTAPVPKMPGGLIELMDGLTRDVLKNNPSDIYEFCADHMKKLLQIRDEMKKPSSTEKRSITLEQKIALAKKLIGERAALRREEYDKSMPVYNTEGEGNINNKKEDSATTEAIECSKGNVMKIHEMDLSANLEHEIVVEKIKLNKDIRLLQEADRITNTQPIAIVEKEHVNNLEDNSKTEILITNNKTESVGDEDKFTEEIISKTNKCENSVEDSVINIENIPLPESKDEPKITIVIEERKETIEFSNNKTENINSLDSDKKQDVTPTTPVDTKDDTNVSNNDNDEITTVDELNITVTYNPDHSGQSIDNVTQNNDIDKSLMGISVIVDNNDSLSISQPDLQQVGNSQSNEIILAENVKDIENQELLNEENELNKQPSSIIVENADEDKINYKELVSEVNNTSMDLETAAITIQKVFRSFLFRNKTLSSDDATNVDINLLIEDKEKKDIDDVPPANANKDRRALGRIDTVLQTVNEEKSLSLSTDDSSTLSSAATIIQAHVRGFLVRNKFNLNKANSSTSGFDSDGHSTTSFEVDNDSRKNKTILNIHIVPEGGHFMSRDESMLTSIDLSVDGSPSESTNLHPLSYDTSERRKQLKREDAIQSVSPPSDNSGKQSVEVDSVKEILEQSTQPQNQIEINNTLNARNNNTSANINNVGTVLIEHDSIKIEASDSSLPSLTSDEMDVVTPFATDSDNDSRIMHSGEFHDVVLPTKVSRTDTSVVRGE